MKTFSGKYLERLVAAIHHAETKGATVTWNDSIDGRQFDVTLRFKHGLHTYLTVIECKDYSSKVPVEKVDAFVTKACDAKANKAVMVSTHGFQSGCSHVADRHGVELLVLTETCGIPVAELVARITPGLNIFNISFDLATGQGAVEFEEWGGKLAYLAKHSVLIHQQDTKTVEQLIFEWQLTGLPLELEREVRIELPLPKLCKLKMPGEAAVPVSTMRFTCRLVNLQVLKGTGLDAHILEGMLKRVELRDPKGNLCHAAQLKDVPLGFDAKVSVGKFYEIPGLFTRYVCDKIEGDIVTWTCLEAYQHGQSIMATYTQDLKYAEHYVEIKDSKIIRRLEIVLAELNKQRK